MQLVVMVYPVTYMPHVQYAILPLELLGSTGHAAALLCLVWLYGSFLRKHTLVDHI